MHVVIAIVVFVSLSAAGLLGALWRLGGQLARQADRIGVGALRGGILLQRFRVPILLWGAVLAVLALVLTIAWRDRTSVVAAFAVAGALTAGVIGLAPKYTPRILRAVARRAKRLVSARLTRRRS